MRPIVWRYLRRSTTNLRAVSLDGAIENPQNWSPPYWDDEHADYARKLLWDADALLLRCKNYESFAQAWPARAGADDSTDRINEMPKYVTFQDP